MLQEACTIATITEDPRSCSFAFDVRCSHFATQKVGIQDSYHYSFSCHVSADSGCKQNVSSTRAQSDGQRRRRTKQADPDAIVSKTRLAYNSHGKTDSHGKMVDRSGMVVAWVRDKRFCQKQAGFKVVVKTPDRGFTVSIRCTQNQTVQKLSRVCAVPRSSITLWWSEIHIV